MSRLLIVEHDPIIAADLFIGLDDLGADPLEPCATIGEALDRVEAGDVAAASLDVRMMGESSRAVAQALSERELPFAYVTGDDSFVPGDEGWPDAPVISKPLRTSDLTRIASLASRD